MRSGTVALFGRSNVGKSTFLNKALEQRLAITSPLPQTTRDVLLGVVHHADAQIAFLDTPGLHQPKSELGRRMNLAALEAARGTDCLVFMTDTRELAKPKRKAISSPPRVSDQDRALLELLPQFGKVPALLVINKVDLLKDKRLLIPFIDELQNCADFAATIPISVTKSDGVDRVLSELAKLLPTAEPAYASDTLTDRPTRFFVAEFVREQVLRVATREVPHAVAVSIDTVNESDDALRASATIHVQKQGQRAILVGRGGSVIRSIGIGARQRLAELLGKPVHLKLFVRITPRWKDVPRQLSELGYEGPASPELKTLEHSWQTVLTKRGQA